VTIKVNDVKVTNGQFTPTASGNYTITVESKETGMYKAGFNSTVFEVVKLDSFVKVNASARFVGEDVLINISAPNDIDGVVNVRVGNMNYTVDIVNGNGSLAVSGLGNGTYNVTVIYIENDRYYSNTNKTNFTVYKNATEMTITVGPTHNYNTVIPVVIDVPGIESGKLTIKVNDTEYEAAIADGKAYLNITDIAVGNYTINATFAGNDYYNASKATGKFSVVKIMPFFGIITNKTVYAIGEIAFVSVYCTNGDPTGIVTINVDGKNYTAEFTGNFAEKWIDAIYVPGTYKVTAYYNGDRNYTEVTVSAMVLKVAKVDDYLMNITATETSAGENSTITVYVPADATGNVTIWVNGTKLNASVSEGKAVFNVTKDKAGLYTVNATLDDIKYTNHTVMTKYRVFKLETPISINVTDIHVGDVEKIVVTVPVDVSNNVTIEINGKSYTNKTVNGNATFHVAGLTAGNKTVTATYNGDDKYVFNSKTANFTVSKYNSPVEITINPNAVHYVNSTFTIKVESNTTVNVTINGKPYNVKADGTVDIDTSVLAAGDYIINAVVFESDRFKANSTNKTFSIVKYNVNITVEDIVGAIVAGTQVEFTAKLNDTVSGDVIFTINGANYTSHVSAGNVATCLYTPVNNEQITVVATFMGSYKHNSNVSAEKQFNVNRIPTVINVTVKTPVTYGDAAEITVELDATINATVKLSIDGNDHDVALINGKGIFNASGLTSGDHNVLVVFGGDDRYNRSENSTGFTVDKAALNAEATALNVTVEENTTFVINVTDDFNGNVSIKMGDDVLYNGSVKTLINAQKLLAGDKKVNVTFYGDGNYDDLTLKDVKFTVSKVTPSISVSIDI
jgi:hypothetical protein